MKEYLCWDLMTLEIFLTSRSLIIVIISIEKICPFSVIDFFFYWSITQLTAGIKILLLSVLNMILPKLTVGLDRLIVWYMRILTKKNDLNTHKTSHYKFQTWKFKFRIFKTIPSYILQPVKSYAIWKNTFSRCIPPFLDSLRQKDNKKCFIDLQTSVDVASN